MLTLDDAEASELVADWLELELSLGEASFSKSKVSSIIRDASGIEPSEAFVSDVWRHMRARAALYTSQFFEVNGDVVVRRNDVVEGRLEYEVCLFFSLYGASSQTGSDPKLFERMSAEAIGRHIDGPVFVFGWPVLPDVQTAIAARVKQVSELLRERFVEAPATRYKDRGVDIISWKPFAEPTHATRRSGQLVMLSQCAAGHDWRKKTRELPMASWTQYIHWATDPIPGFAVPCVIGADVWHDVAREVEGLVFDRVRLMSHLPQGVQGVGLKAALETWRTEQIDEHRA
jgi:hypothetical protein